MKNLAFAIAKTIINGFERHIYLYSEITKTAKQRFEQQRWHDIQLAAKARTDFYDQRIEETLTTIKQDFLVTELNDELWQYVKSCYIDLLSKHPQPELAESFYNSIFCHLFEREYYHNAYIFVQSTATRLDTLPTPKIFTRYFPAEQGLFQTISHIMNSQNFSVPFTHLKKDINILIAKFRQHADKTHYQLSDLQFDILDSVFYRNKGAYIIGRVISPGGETPFIISLLNTEKEGFFIDALITEGEDMAVVFGFARAYFFVDCQHPHALIVFLNRLTPHKTSADLYSAIGFHKQGKTQFYRDFLSHLDNSDDKLVLAPGIKGMVMSVFMLPSYPYVFKIIKDKFSPSKNMTRDDVKGKYRLVKLHDRVGRMADTMEYSEVAFPKQRFSAELLAELNAVAPSLLRYEDDLVIIKHMYIERKMTPLNLYLATANDAQVEHAMYGYGEAIKQLIAANIFPGDMLLKNFGVTRHGDVFPEEIATFALANNRYRQAFLGHHANLLQAQYWQDCQASVAKGVFADVYPYPEESRFCH
jgi:isocitrate dehydrogenase kinase/phosphatase